MQIREARAEDYAEAGRVPARWGIGRALVEACLEVSRGAGKTTATLHTAEEMVAARTLYGSLGFERDPAEDVEPTPGIVLRPTGSR